MATEDPRPVGGESPASGIEVEESNEFEQVELSSRHRLGTVRGFAEGERPPALVEDEPLLAEDELFLDDSLPVGMSDRLMQAERRCLELATLVSEQAARLAALEEEHHRLSVLVRERIDAAAPARIAPLAADEEPTIAADPPRSRGDRPAATAAGHAGLIPHCVLLPVEDAGAEVFELNRPRAYIGRGAEADLRIGDATVSRLHAIIRSGDGGLVIEDVGSRNGLFVNDFRVRRAVVHDGDRVTFGTVSYIVRVLPGNGYSGGASQ